MTTRGGRGEPGAPTQVRKLLAAAPERYRPLLAIAAFTGMRIQEILGLAWGDIDFRERVIRVLSAAQPWNEDRSRRVASISRPRRGGAISLSQASSSSTSASTCGLTELATGLPRADAYVFTTSSGKPSIGNNVAKRGLDNAARCSGPEPR